MFKCDVISKRWLFRVQPTDDAPLKPPPPPLLNGGTMPPGICDVHIPRGNGFTVHVICLDE